MPGKKSIEDIIKSLTKLLDSMVIKGRVKFRVDINPYTSEYSNRWADDEESTTHYPITYTFTNDHAKYWEDSPQFSQEYNDLINSIDFDNLSDKLEEVPKYFLFGESSEITIRWEHYNTDTYNPLLDALGMEQIPYVTKFTIYQPNINIILSNDYIFERSDLQVELGFTFDNIVMYSEDISGDK
jgi:hypothetical protein